MKAFINHWQYNDGWQYAIPMTFPPTYDFDADAQGWFCWVYTRDDDAFVKWMQDNMQHDYDCTFRFNGGNCMYTVWIRNKNDAALFAHTFDLRI